MTTNMHRRHFLKSSLVASLYGVSGRAWSMQASDQRLLIVFLRGGCDMLNVVVPTGSEFYYEARPSISIARPDPLSPNAALPLDSEWSLHPALRETIYPLWAEKQIAFVPFAGADDPSRSHFETQNTIELGQPINHQRNYRSGFMARLAEEVSSSRAITFTARMPLAFSGANRAIPNVAPTLTNKDGISDHQIQLIKAMYERNNLRAAIAEGFEVRDKANQIASANTAKVPSDPFELSARQAARLLREDYNLAFLDMGGWDTHVNQGSTTGTLASRLRQLGTGLSAFIETIGPSAWRNSTVVVMSEFGRTFRENGDQGTDHGRGGAYWILGGTIAGGRVAGRQIKLNAETLNEGRDLSVLTNYRDLLGGLMGKLYGLTPAALDRIFPSADPLDMGLI